VALSTLKARMSFVVIDRLVHADKLVFSALIALDRAGLLELPGSVFATVGGYVAYELFQISITIDPD